MPRHSSTDSYNDETNRDMNKDIVWSSGLKATKPRIAIVKTLSAQKQPISILELHKILQKDSPKISNTSIYRTLEALVQSGVVSRINTGKAHASYEMIDGRKHHHHIICKKCGDMEDVDICPIRSNIEMYESQTKKFKIIQEHSLEFFSICKKCS